jgi:hypothetical protein
MADEPIDLAAAREQTLEVIRKEYPPLLTSAHVAELMQCTICSCPRLDLGGVLSGGRRSRMRLGGSSLARRGVA